MPRQVAPLEPEDHELVALAQAAIDRATDTTSPAEDGIHTMGAAVRDVAGNTFVGVNLFHFTGGPCAELVALATARAGSGLEPQTIVAVGNHGRGVRAPCGRDRQVMSDYYPHLRVILPTEAQVGVVIASEVLPDAFDWTAENEE